MTKQSNESLLKTDETYRETAYVKNGVKVIEFRSLSNPSSAFFATEVDVMMVTPVGPIKHTFLLNIDASKLEEAFEQRDEVVETFHAEQTQEIQQDMLNPGIVTPDGQVHKG